MDMDSRRLRKLSGDLGRIAEEIAAAADQARAQPVTADIIRAILRARRARYDFLENGLLGEPAWDMLLDLLAARLEARSVSVSSLCTAAAVPATTALRCITTLTEMGYIVRRPDPKDRRRVLLELSDEAASRVSAALTAAKSALAPAI